MVVDKVDIFTQYYLYFRAESLLFFKGSKKTSKQIWDDKWNDNMILSLRLVSFNKLCVFYCKSRQL